jgi:drug/metabolite transporter (DMT)-like permease
MAPATTSTEAKHVSRGIGLRIGAALSFSLMGALLKLASARGANIGEMVFYRSLLGLPVVLAWAATSQGWSSLTTRRPMVHVTRSAIGVASMFFVFQALILLPLGEVTTISFTAPLFATLLSALFLGERVGPRRLTAALVGFAGVVVVMRPGANEAVIPPLGVACGLIAAMLAASVFVTLRRLRDTEHVAAIVFWFLTGSTLAGLAAMALLGARADEIAILLMAAAGVLGGLAQIFMTASLHAAPIAVLAPFDYLQLIGAVALGWMLLDTEPTWNTFAGAALIAGSGLYTAWRERQRRLNAAPAAAAPPT